MPDKMSNAAAEREAAKKALSTGSLAERETYTAKQVATRCGTDAKTMRKFFRSTHSTVEPVGQGGRYEFAATDLPKIKEEFDAWSTRGKKAAPPRKPAPKKAEVAEPEAVEEVEENDDDSPWEPHPALAEIDPSEPTEAELEEMAKLISVEDLDLDDLDAEEL